MPTQVLLVVVVLAAGIVVGRLVSASTGLPDAAVYVALGVAAAFVPGIAQVRLSPDLVLLLFLTVVVVLATLVGQTVPLPWLMRTLRLDVGHTERTEAVRARRAAVDAALRELDAVAAADGADPPGVDELRQILGLRRDHLHDQVEGDRGEPAAFDVAGLRLRLLETERETLRGLYADGEISRRTMVAISQDLDLDETQLRRRP